MTTPEPPEPPPGVPFPDDRWLNALARASQDELETALGQTAALGRPYGDPEILIDQTAQNDDILARRDRKIGGEGLRDRLKTGAKLVQLERRDDANTFPPFFTLDEILVRTSDLGPIDRSGPGTVRGVLAGVSFLETDVPELESRVTRLSVQDVNGNALAAQDLQDLVEQLQVAGFDASLNLVIPCGYIAKAVPGAVGPTPAISQQGQFQPPPEVNRRVVVAIIDTGIDRTARNDGWLQEIQTTTRQLDFDPLNEFQVSVPPPLILDKCAGHGTFVSGVVQQVAPGATVRMYRAIDGDGIGADVDVAIALWQAVQEGANIANMSLGTMTPNGAPPLATLVALELIDERTRLHGGQEVVVVCAAGNTGGEDVVYPAAFSADARVSVPVVAVAGWPVVGGDAFSTFGSQITCSTNATAVLSTFVTGRAEWTDIGGQQSQDYPGPDQWAVWSGTSFAAPQVAGAIAKRSQEGDWTSPMAALQWLLSTGTTLVGYGQRLKIL